MPLETYKRKRNFGKTSEPEGKIGRDSKHRFVVQEHHASRLHFDFRLEMGGVLKSWAVPKGPTLDPSQKRLAVMTEDHPVQYLHYEGCIAEGNYGAGEMRVWDTGHFAPEGDALQGVENGRLRFELSGEKLRGAWTLLRMKHSFGRQANDGKSNWLLVKAEDEYSNPDWEIETILPPPEGWNENQKPRERKVRAVSKAQSSGAGRTSKKGKGPVVPLEEALSKKFKGDDAQAQIGDSLVALTNLNKILWPDDGFTKRDLIGFYASIADTILPHLQNRALILKRYPGGINGPSFFQHNIESAPEFVETLEVEVTQGKGKGEGLRYAMCNNLASLLYLANSTNIAFSPWHSRSESPGQPDWIVFDLDPGEVEYSAVCRIALSIRELLNGFGLQCYPKTSGASGMHVYLPVGGEYSYDEAARFAERVARLLQKREPEIITLERSLKKREPDKVYFDHLQNAEGKTVVAPYSVRARPGATVAAPLEWKEVETCPDPQKFTIENFSKRLKVRSDLFAPVLQNPHSPHELQEAEAEINKLLRKRRTK